MYYSADAHHYWIFRRFVIVTTKAQIPRRTTSSDSSSTQAMIASQIAPQTSKWPLTQVSDQSIPDKSKINNTERKMITIATEITRQMKFKTSFY